MLLIQVLKCWCVVLGLVYLSASTDILGTAEQLPKLCDDESRSFTCAEAPRKRFKRSFGGREAINFTQVNNSTLGPAGFLSTSSGAMLDLTFYVSGYIVLGRRHFSRLNPTT